MTRKQRAEKLAKRREEQKRHRGRQRVEKHGRHTIFVDAGPQRSPSYHRTDPYKHGEALRQAEQIITFCDRIGFKPTAAQIEMLRDLMREGRLTEKAVMAISRPETVDDMPLVSSAPRARRAHADEVELMQQHPTEEEWTELEATAKRKRRGAKGFIKVLTDAGYVLGKDEDPKVRQSWMKA